MIDGNRNEREMRTLNWRAVPIIISDAPKPTWVLLTLKRLVWTWDLARMLRSLLEKLRCRIIDYLPFVVPSIIHWQWLEARLLLLTAHAARTKRTRLLKFWAVPQWVLPFWLYLTRQNPTLHSPRILRNRNRNRNRTDATGRHARTKNDWILNRTSNLRIREL